MTNLEVAAKLEAALDIIRNLRRVSFPSYAVEKVITVEDELELAVKFLKIQG